MAHRRVKDIDYDEEEFDDYYSGEDDYGYEGEATTTDHGDGEDDLSAEDKEQMRLGTESVREALGDDFASVTDAAIQEALWHYYYDVAKSVTYLKSKSAPITTCHTAKLMSPRPSRSSEAASTTQEAQASLKVRPSCRLCSSETCGYQG